MKLPIKSQRQIWPTWLVMTFKNKLMKIKFPQWLLSRCEILRLTALKIKKKQNDKFNNTIQFTLCKKQLYRPEQLSQNWNRAKRFLNKFRMHWLVVWHHNNGQQRRSIQRSYMIVRWKEIWLTIIVACMYRMILARTQFNLGRLRLLVKFVMA